MDIDAWARLQLNECGWLDLNRMNNGVSDYYCHPDLDTAEKLEAQGLVLQVTQDDIKEKQYIMLS